jgi:WXG100 family type VII secretion target
MVDRADLDTSEDDLTHLADDLGAMRDHLDQQVRRMDTIVDTIQAGWRSNAASGYRDVHLSVTKDVVRVREMLGVIEEAVRMSRDGFTEQELDTLQRMRREESAVDVTAEAEKLMEPQPPAAPPSRILDV